jgi:hypothetical protein
MFAHSGATGYALKRRWRRVRFGRPVIVVSGLPRSGTSLMMQMLEAGGVGIVSDGVREADEGNLQGYFEVERVKDLESDSDTSWLREARGKAIKVILMHRDLDEVLDSQARLLALRGETSDTDDAQMREMFESHLSGTKRMLEACPCFEFVEVSYNEILSGPAGEAERVSRFLDGRLDVERMAAMVNPELYRSRG